MRTLRSLKQVCSVDYWVEKSWKWSRGERWNGGKGEGFCTQNNRLPGRGQTSVAVKEQCSGAIQMPRLCLFTEVLHIQTPRTRKGSQTQHTSSIQKIVTTGDAAQPKVMLSSVASLYTCLHLRSFEANSLSHCGEEMHTDVLF